MLSVVYFAQGKGQNPKQYSSRYVCSLVADFHRTLVYGGWAANPREHLRLVYEANPLAFLAEQVRSASLSSPPRMSFGGSNTDDAYACLPACLPALGLQK